MYAIRDCFRAPLFVSNHSPRPTTKAKQESHHANRIENQKAVNLRCYLKELIPPIHATSLIKTPVKDGDCAPPKLQEVKAGRLGDTESEEESIEASSEGVSKKVRSPVGKLITSTSVSFELPVAPNISEKASRTV